MKIGMFTDSYLPARDGVATSVAATAHALTQRGHEVYIIAPAHPHVKDTAHVYRIFSVQIYKEPEIRVALEIPQLALLKISVIDFDIIHGHSGGPISFMGWQLARARNIPFIETYHTLWKYYQHYIFFPKLLTPGLIKKISVLFGNDCDAIIAPTDKVKKELLSYGIRTPIYVVPSGIEMEQFEHTNKGYLHATLRLPSTCRIILSVGRLEKEKSMDFLITAFSMAYADCPNTVLVLVGEGRDKEKLQCLARAFHIEQAVLFTGAVPYRLMPSIYSDADLFVFASQTEAQGLVIMEALAAGLPVLAVDDAAFDGVIRDGFNGYTLKKNSSLFAQKMITLMGTKPLRMKLAYHAITTAHKHSASQTALSLEQIYRELIDQKKHQTPPSWSTRIHNKIVQWMS